MNQRSNFRLISVILCVAMIGTVFTSCATGATTVAPTTAKAAATGAANVATTAKLVDKIYFGVTAGITGDAPLEGETMTRSVTLACEIINADGGVLGKQLVPIFEDDGYKVEGAITVANKFIADKRIVAIAGPGRSNCFVAISDIVKAARIAVVTPATSPAFAKLNNPYWFRDRTTDGINSKIAANFLVKNLNCKRIGVMVTNDDSGMASKPIIEAELKLLGIETQTIVYTGGEIDYSGQILKLRDYGCDAMIIWGHTTDQAVITRNMNQLGYKIPIIGNTGFMSATYLDLVEDKVADGLYAVTDINLQSDDKYVKWFLEKFKARYPDKKVDITDAIHFAHAFVIADAIKRAGSTDRQAIADALAKTKDLPSVLGPLTCDAEHNLAHTATIFRNVGKKATVVQSVSLNIG